MSDSDNNKQEIISPAPPSGKARDIVAVQLERLARTQRRRLVADIVAKVGVKRLEMAEDVVQDAVLAAMKTWPFKGMPDNPAAWLNRVARNKAYDRLRREGREQSTTGEDGVEQEPISPDSDAQQSETDTAHSQFFGAKVDDPELKLIFLCCHEEISEEDRLMLTLKVVSGFTARDIAALFLKGEAAVGQRMARTKRKLRALDSNKTGHSDLSSLSRFSIQARTDTVLKVIYLMFAMGYAPRSGDRLVLQDVAMEALRLAEVMANARETARPAAHALVALLSFQASRFAARIDAAEGDGEILEKLVLLRDQDRSLWDRKLIMNGMAHLQSAQSGGMLSRYHIEAGIASIHATAPCFEETNWSAICQLYTQLEGMTQSPVVTMNACAAQAMSGKPEKAFLRLEALKDRMGDGAANAYAPYHIARGEILRMLSRPADAAACFKAALACDTSAPVISHLKHRLASCV